MSKFPQPKSVEECWLLVCAMREEAAREVAYTRSEPSRRILWGMIDALAELERRIHDGQANLHWAHAAPATPRPAPEPLADRDSQSPAPSSSRSSAPSPDHDPAHDPLHPPPKVCRR